jgi:hypothetical protein
VPDVKPSGDVTAVSQQNAAGEASSAPDEQGAPAKKPFKKFHKRPPKAITPE